tara:strand:- start:1556 stop:2065 length:510 start_codon:yes stop_codon:yes gene_type:complete
MSKIEQKLKSLEDSYSNQNYEIWWEEAPECYNNNEPGAYRIQKQMDGIINSIRNLKLPTNSKILDICCGLPILPAKIKEEFPDFKVYGIDIYTNEYNEFSKYSKGCKIYKFPFQMLFEDSYENNIDFELITMFNSFRAFEEKVQKNILNWYKQNGKRFMYDNKGVEILQ